MYTILFIETFLYVCGNSAILLNNIHSIYGKSTFLHFSEGLVHIVYIDYLTLAASYENNCSVDKVTDTQIESMLDRLAKNYDGYCFDEFYKKKVFSTWSTLII